MKLTLWRVVVVLNTHTMKGSIFPKLRMFIKDNNNSPQGKFH